MQWIFQVRRDGHIVNEIVLKGKPRTYGYVRLYISDKFYGPGLAVIKNLVYRNTDYTGDICLNGNVKKSTEYYIV